MFPRHFRLWDPPIRQNLIFVTLGSSTPIAAFEAFGQTVDAEMGSEA